jgi:hypothetical protein
MNLSAYQRAVMRIVLSREPASEDLAALGQEPRWQIYRHMVRTRVEDMARKAFKETHALLGEAVFCSVFAHFLEQAPPSSPLIRDVVAAFGEFLQQSAALEQSEPWVADMLRFERARWQVAYQQAPLPQVGADGVRELDFEGALVVNPVLRVLTLEHPVHREDSAWPSRLDTHLLVYRTLANEIRWWAATPLFATLLTRAQGPTRDSLADAVRACSTQLSLVLDQALLESLSDELTLAIQRTVVIGVR